MIFFNASKNKITSLTVLTLVASTVIFWQWLQFSTSFKINKAQENSSPNIIEEIQEQTGDLLVDAKDSFVQGVEQVQFLTTEIQKSQEQDQLLEVTRAYLENKE